MGHSARGWAGAVIILGLCLFHIVVPAGALIADGIAKTITGVFIACLSLARPTKQISIGLYAALYWHDDCSIAWNCMASTNRILFPGVSGVVFLILCVGLLLLVKPLSTSVI